MSLKNASVLRIEYEKVKGDNIETSQRVIIPVSVPTNIKALDVTELAEEDRAELAQLFQQYKEYYDTQVKTIFSFEGWLEHTQHISYSPKWRTFKLEHVKEIVD